MKEIADAVGSQLQDHLGAGLVRHRLQHAGGVGLGVRPVRHLGAVEQLQGGRAADAAGAGGADRVAAVERVEAQLVRIGHAGRRRVGAMVLETLDHLEQVPGRLLGMGEDEDALAGGTAGAMVVAAAHVGRAALQAALEDERAHLAGLGLLRLERGVDVALDPVEHQRLDRAALAADAQLLGREQLVVGVKPRLPRALLRLALGLRRAVRRLTSRGRGLVEQRRIDGRDRCPELRQQDRFRRRQGDVRALRIGDRERPARHHLLGDREPVLQPRVDRDAELDLEQRHVGAVPGEAELDLRERLLGDVDAPGQIALADAERRAHRADQRAVVHRFVGYGHGGFGHGGFGHDANMGCGWGAAMDWSAACPGRALFAREPGPIGQPVRRSPRRDKPCQMPARIKKPARRVPAGAVLPIAFRQLRQPVIRVKLSCRPFFMSGVNAGGNSVRPLPLSP